MLIIDDVSNIATKELTIVADKNSQEGSLNVDLYYNARNLCVWVSTCKFYSGIIVATVV